METKTVAMRMPTALHAKVTMFAQREHRNVTQTILYLIERSLTEPTQSGATSRPSTSDDCAAPEAPAETADRPAYAAPR
jgi:hypothetical protein